MNQSQRIGACLALAVACFGLFYLSCAYAQPAGFTLDFEEGNLRGWDRSGTAFDYQPTLHDNPAARGRGQASNHTGNYWIGTFERFQGLPGQQRGAIQGDEPQGTLTSSAFTVNAQTLSFLVGGGKTPDTRVELLIALDNMDKETVYFATGQDSETMQRVTWDLAPYRGSTAYIRIVDESSAPWGHINVDDFRFVQEGGISETVVTRVTDAARDLPGEPGLAERSREMLEVVPREELVAVPYVVGRDQKVAGEILREAGLEVEDVSYRDVADHEPNTVVSQSPKARSQVPRGTGISLVVASGELVAVPDVVGRDLDLAIEILGRADLGVGHVKVEAVPDRPHNTVTSQLPRAGRRVPAGTGVDLVVTPRRPEPERPDADMVEVPDVVDRHLDLAKEILGQARLEVGELGSMASDAPAGHVLRQSPRAGRRVPVGTRVALMIARAEPGREPPAIEEVQVPDVVGRDIKEAREMLARVRLEVGTVDHTASDEAVGQVLRQSPRAGAIVPVSTPVNLAVARKTAVIPWAGIGAGLGAGVGAYLLLSKLRGSRRVGGQARPTLAIRPERDAGNQCLESQTSTPSGPELRLKIVVDHGEQDVEPRGSSTGNERGNHECS